MFFISFTPGRILHDRLVGLKTGLKA